MRQAVIKHVSQSFVGVAATAALGVSGNISLMVAVEGHQTQAGSVNESPLSEPGEAPIICVKVVAHLIRPEPPPNLPTPQIRSEPTRYAHTKADASDPNRGEYWLVFR